MLETGAQTLGWDVDRGCGAVDEDEDGVAGRTARIVEPLRGRTN